MSLTHSGATTPRSTDPKRACSTDRIPFVHRCQPLAAERKPTAATHSRTADAPALELQAIQRQAALTGWGSESYLAVARWCHRHRPEHTGLWLRLALGVAL